MDLLIGGARSGKSRLAARMAAATGVAVHMVVTATASDDEMAERIRRHRNERPAEWTTVEAPHELATALRTVPDDACVLLDCLSLWVSNRLGEGLDEDAIGGESAAAISVAAERTGATIVVTNEVGHGLVPMHPAAAPTATRSAESTRRGPTRPSARCTWWRAASCRFTAPTISGSGHGWVYGTSGRHQRQGDLPQNACLNE